MLQALFALFRFPFSLSVHLIYLRLLTVLPAILILQPAYQTVSDDFFLYYISFVYLKSIKDLSSFRLPFLSESGCKGKCFFSFCQTFQKFFSKKFFPGKPEGWLSRSLGQYQGKILAQSRADPQQNFSACRFSYLSPLSRKRLQRYSLFPFLQILWNTFFKQFSIIFIINCKSIVF